MKAYEDASREEVKKINKDDSGDETQEWKEEKENYVKATYGENATVETLSLKNAYTENHTGVPMPLCQNDGKISYLYTSNLHTDGDELFVGEGSVDHLYGEFDKN
jgi:hypothetical protein